MSEQRYICITCGHFYDRHEHILKQHKMMLDKSFKLPHFLLQHDISSGLMYTSKGYRRHLWPEHIDKVMPFHMFNYLCVTRGIDGYEVKKSLRMGQENANIYNNEQWFPARALRLTEQSLIHKHYEALKIAAKSSSPTFVIEDDAVIRFSRQVDNIEQAMSIATKENVFINLVNAPHNSKEEVNDDSVYKLNIARSYTTGAYIVSPTIARILVEEFFPYSLPIDFHLQYLFKVNSIKGYSISRNGIKNGSLGKEMESTV